jgi:DNA polymerase I-like protein with 3'-5' exonuclease and polymerase domains
VHDALIFDVEKSAVDEVVGVGTEVMSQWESHGVPLVVDCKVGESWGSLEKYSA